MADVLEDKEGGAKEFGDVRRTPAPSKKKFDEEMDALCSNIRKTEEQLELLKNGGPVSVADTLKDSRAEVKAMIERRKKIDEDLEKLNKEITSMMNNISRLESTLHYRSEQKIDDAIGRLDWSLKAQNFSLTQEKKIVAEIDSLRRSKKTLMQYLNMKKEKDAMRDRQRKMRQERDHYFHAVTQLKQKEDKVKSDNVGHKAKLEQLKRELDTLYEAKRQMAAVYKKQRGDFFDDREKRWHESFKKRQEEKQTIQDKFRQEREEMDVQKQPYQDDICLCNTLIVYLQRYGSSTDLDASSPWFTATTATLASSNEETSPNAPRPVEELEDGYKLLRKSDDDNYVSCSAKHAARKHRRSRKASMVKRVTHTPEVLAQFLQLNLNAPATMAEIVASLEQLMARKAFFERDAEVKSEAELSVTESAQTEMSRQASHTESYDGLSESRPNEQVMEQLLQLCVFDEAGSSCQLDLVSPLGQTSPRCKFEQGLGCADKHETRPTSLQGHNLPSPYRCFPPTQGQSFASMVAGDHVETAFLMSPLDDDFPALCSSSGSDLAHSRSDSTSRSTCTVDGATEGQAVLDPRLVHGRRPSKMTAGSDFSCGDVAAGGDVYYAKKNSLTDSTECDPIMAKSANTKSRAQSVIVSTLSRTWCTQSSKDAVQTTTASPASAGGGESFDGNPPDAAKPTSVIRGTGSGKAAHGKAWKDCDVVAAPLVGSVQDFPALMSNNNSSNMSASLFGASRASSSLDPFSTMGASLGSNGGNGLARKDSLLLGCNSGPISGEVNVSLASFPTGGNGICHSAVFKDERCPSKDEAVGVTESTHL